MKQKWIFAVLVGSLVLSLAGCNLPSMNPSFGTIRIINTYIRASEPFPAGRRLPLTREYGICIVGYPVPAPAGLAKPTYDLILAKDSSTTNFALPAASYQIQEFQFDSEINTDPSYLPEYKTYVRPVETIRLAADQVLIFGSERTLVPPPGDFVEGPFLNNACNNEFQQQISGKLTYTARASTGTPKTSTPLPPTITAKAITSTVKPVTNTPQPTTGGAWVLRQVETNAGKKEEKFSYPGISCSGGTTASSTENSATTISSGTCQIRNAQTANAKTTHTWTRPPDRLVPGQELTGSMTASSTGICSWQDSITEVACRSQTSTAHTVWIGDGGPGTSKDFPYQNLVYGNDYATSARAGDQPTGSFKWKIPTGGGSGRTTLVIQFYSHAWFGYVYTNFWYDWSTK